MIRIIFIALFLMSFQVKASSQSLEANKKTVLMFYDLAFNKHQPAEAMKLYVGEKYIQHNPFAGDGKQPFISFFTDYYSKNSSAFVEIKRTIAQDDLVVVHALSKRNKQDRGSAVIDIFRLKKNKIIEHWDVVQTIPESSANDNSMF